MDMTRSRKLNIDSDKLHEEEMAEKHLPYLSKMVAFPKIVDFIKKYQALDNEKPDGKKESLLGRILMVGHLSRESKFLLSDGVSKLEIIADRRTCDVGNVKLGHVVIVTGLPEKIEGKLCIRADSFAILASCLHNLRRKLISDPNMDEVAQYKLHCLDLTREGEVSKLFRTRSKVISYIRKYLFEKGLLEVEVPPLKGILGDVATRPFLTEEHNQHISPDLYLKELIHVGLEAVFKINNHSRDKGTQLLQNSEFTTCEIHVPFAECNDLMEMIELMLSGMVKELMGGYVIKFHPDSQANHLIEIDFSPPFRRIDMIEELEKSADLSLPEDLDSNEAKECLLDACVSHNVQCAFPQTPGRLLDKLVNHFLVETCVKPTFLQHNPKLSLEAESKQSRAGHAALFINKHKVCDTYTDLNDPAAHKTLTWLKDHVGVSVSNDLEKLHTLLSCGLPPTVVGTLNVDTFSMIMTNEISCQPVHHSASTHKYFEFLSNHKFRWEFANDAKILQPPIQQEQGMCAFAALARQLDYQLRILYSDASKGSLLKQDCCLFDYIKWRYDLEKEFPLRKTRWRPDELLHEANTRGLQLWNGGSHVIQFIRSMASNMVGFLDELKKLLRCFPVVGVIKVFSTFSDDGSDVYVEGCDSVYEQLCDEEGKLEEKSLAYHAVVLVDFCECDGTLYLAYQNSQGNPNKSMCKLGISWLDAKVLKEVHYGASTPPVHPPNVLQSQNQMAETLYYINSVSEGFRISEHSYDEGKALIEHIRVSRHLMSDNDLQAWNQKVGDHIEGLRHTSNCMKTFAIKYKGVNDAAVAGIQDVPRLLIASKECDNIAKKADELQVLHQNALLNFKRVPL